MLRWQIPSPHTAWLHRKTDGSLDVLRIHECHTSTRPATVNQLNGTQSRPLMTPIWQSSMLNSCLNTGPPESPSHPMTPLSDSSKVIVVDFTASIWL